MLTESTAVRLSSGTKPELATWPEISAMRIGPPSWSADSRPMTTSSGSDSVRETMK